MSAKFDELVAKLKEIFQIDKPELDFGVYRILHARQKEISDFLENRLAAKVKESLAGNAANEEGEVYSHLLTFFSRYYEDGDFISKRRYKGDTYAIPYSGEEVKLYWANADQYYTKSGESFTNYSFSIPGGAKVHFTLVTAETAKDNVKDSEAVRCFRLWNPENTPPDIDEEEAKRYPKDFLDEKDGELYIYFQYLKFKKGTKQKELLADAVAKLLPRIVALPAFQGLAAAAPTEKDKARTLLQKHLERYTAKNTSDYFIHKDLKRFLTRELDFYIKNEMMHLDDIADARTFRQIEADLRKIQTVRTIATELITFMAQLEDFQKKLWLKKKFVVQCDWCMTLDIVEKYAPELMAEVMANEAQKEEWKRLGLPDEDRNLSHTEAQRHSEGGRVSSRAAVQGELLPLRGDSESGSSGEQSPDLKNSKTPDSESNLKIDARMVDTKFFDESFKAKLLAAIPDLDERCDGLLIHSENFQALNLLQERYRQQVRCCFVDPPYNTEDSEGENEFSYKDCYQHSSWNSMFENRMRELVHLLSKNGVFTYTISDEELINSLCVTNSVFNAANRIGIVEWNSTKSVTNKALISMGHTHIPIYSVSKSYYITHRLEFRLPDSIEGFENPDNDPRGPWKADPFQVGGERPNQRYAITNPKTGRVYYPNPGNSWKNDFDKFKDLLADNRIVFGVSGEAGPQRKRFWFEAEERGCVPKTWWDTEETTTNGTTSLKNLFAICPFKNPKPVGLLRKLVSLCASPTAIVLDYFGGSGTTAHAVIDLNRQDGGKRKYILVEMGDHFDTVLKPRIEKVVYSPEWKNGKPVSPDKGISHCFKYMTLESYEDALNNIELVDAGRSLDGLLKDEYLLKYMLDVEARGSVINTDDFKHPFDYMLKVSVDSSGASEKRKVDLVETFNYLVGMKVLGMERHIDRGYVIVEGRLPGDGRESLVVWRDCGKVDNAALNRLLEKRAVRPGDSEYKTIFVNGDHAIPNRKLGTEEDAPTLKIRQIENVFLEKMFEEA